MDPMAWTCDSSMLGNNSQKYSTPLNWWVFHGHESHGIESIKNQLKQPKVHGNLPTMDFFRQPKTSGLWRNVPWNLPFRFSLTFGSVFPHGFHPRETHGRPSPSLTLCSSRAAGFGTLAKNSCSKVVRSNSTSCDGGFRWTNAAAILEGRFDCFPHRFLFGAPIKTCIFF